MSDADLLAGNRFRLYREDSTTPGTYDYVALATTVGFTRTNEFEDATAPSLTDPLATPNRRSALKSRSWDVSFSGRMDAKVIADVEADAAADVPHSYRITVDKSAAAGGRSYTGPIWFESLELGTNERGFVTFTAKCRGDGVFTTTAASA